MKTYSDFLAQSDLTIVVDKYWGAVRDEDGWQHNSYSLRISGNDETMVVPWRQGLGVTTSPEDAPEEVLGVLVTEAWSIHIHRNFTVWAAEWDLNADSLAEERRYRRVRRQATAFTRMIGGLEVLEDLAMNYEGL